MTIFYGLLVSITVTQVWNIGETGDINAHFYCHSDAPYSKINNNINTHTANLPPYSLPNSGGCGAVRAKWTFIDGSRAVVV